VHADGQVVDTELGELGTGPQPVGQHSPGHIADTDDEAREQVWPHYLQYVGRLGRERGWPAPTRASFDDAAGPEGALFVGSPETVAQKIVRSARLLGLDRFSLKISQGALAHEHTMRAIELYGTQVAPRVRELLTADQPARED
jgi:alkanesulfonate monooxygenase SsuD/methylene tetrahydromethanopterin reductase-like flavin-dependent oxidoreductase (luciferase family)